MNTIHISKQDIDSHDPSFEPHLDQKEFLGAAGKEHYRLLSWLSTQFHHRTIIDIGTHHGASAAALSRNISNHVHSFDVVDKGLQSKKPNCTYHQLNLWDAQTRQEWAATILSSALIFLDIDPHKGVMEFEFYEWLGEHQYKGILILDDIWHFDGMRTCWYNIHHEKIDLTPIGHWSGTGLVNFGGWISAPMYTYPTDNWTLVTAYFDLTIEPDASDAIKARPAKHYLRYAKSTMGVEQNLVVYCTTEIQTILEKLRPQHLKHKTKFITCNFSDFELIQKYRPIVWKNRKERPNNFDPRNTASYYLFCMLRYVMIQSVMDENPFNSDHFCWINLCIERMGWKNVASLNEALGQQRDKFSTCWIDYQPRSVVNDLPRYFRTGVTSMCSGFFTGRKDYFTQFNTGIMEAFYHCLERGYGHADEQLYPYVYFKSPEIFEPYFGDYTEMVTNYVEVRERVSEPVRIFIPHAFSNKEYAITANACEKIWENRHKITPQNRQLYLRTFIYSAMMTERWDLLKKIKDSLLDHDLSNQVTE